MKIFQSVCEICNQAGVVTPSVAEIFSPWGDKVIEPCAEHEPELKAAVEALRELFEVGTDLKPTKSQVKRRRRTVTVDAVSVGQEASEALSCRLCDKTATTRSGLIQHARKWHAMGIEQMRKEGFDV